MCTPHHSRPHCNIVCRGVPPELKAEKYINTYVRILTSPIFAIV